MNLFKQTNGIMDASVYRRKQRNGYPSGYYFSSIKESEFPSDQPDTPYFSTSVGHFIYILTDYLGAQILEVWTWDGVPKAHYLLDKPVHYIAVSAIHHQIYAVNKEKEGLIYTYKLPVFISG